MAEMSELSDCEFETTMTNDARVLMEKVNNVQEKMENVSR